MRRLFCLLLVVAVGGPVLAQTTVRDSVQMQLFVYGYDYVETPYRNCGVGIYAIWPDVLGDMTGATTRYRDYTLVTPNPNGRTDGEYVPSGLQETLTNVQWGIFVPPDHYGHLPQLGAGLQTGDTLEGLHTCLTSRAKWRAEAARLLNGRWSLLNGGPFRITEWHATFDTPTGEPVAVFDWRQTTSNTAVFDASFPTYSHETQATSGAGKTAVASYAWDFGDGQTGTGATPSHTYAQAGTYTVTLTVTDDDGETDSQSVPVTVTGGVLSVSVQAQSQTVGVGGTLGLLATITNTGTQAVANVQAYPVFVLTPTLPASANVRGVVVRDPVLTAVDAQPDPVTQAVLHPGETLQVRGTYRVDQAASYRLPGSATFEPVDVDLTSSLLDVQAGSGAADPVTVIDACARGACGGSDVSVVDTGMGTDTETASGVGLALTVRPNPATTSVRVPYAVPEAGPVRLGVFDALGREVARLVDGPRPAGRHEAGLEAVLPAGVYLVRLEANGEVRTQRLTVVR